MIETLSSPSAPGTDGYVEWSQFPQPPLGFPRGEAGFFDKRRFGTDWQKRLMRGGDRLVHKCNYMNGICSGFSIQFGILKLFSRRHPSSVSPAGSEEPSWLTASPRGKPRGANHKLNPHNAAGCSSSSYQRCVHAIIPEKLASCLTKEAVFYIIWVNFD